MSFKSWEQATWQGQRNCCLLLCPLGGPTSFFSQPPTPGPWKSNFFRTEYGSFQKHLASVIWEDLVSGTLKSGSLHWSTCQASAPVEHRVPAAWLSTPIESGPHYSPWHCCRL
jgi:hypothetical protein